MTTEYGDPNNPTKDRRINIKVPEQYREVDGEIWSDLEQFLNHGFLTASVNMLKHSFVFKTINQYEMTNVSFLKPYKADSVDIESMYRATFLAYSVFMIDGRNVIYNRPNNINKIISTFKKIDPEIQSRLIIALSKLNERANRLYPLTEVYAYETRSRYRWLQIKDSPIHSPIITGISGTDELGMNLVQQTWVALNRIIDYRDNLETEWTHAKFIGSCFNGKGVRSVDERDRGRREKEKSEREDLKMKVLYKYLNRKSGNDEEPPDLVRLPNGKMATISKRFRAESVDQLADQLSAALSGEKDHHDMVISKYMKKIEERQSETDNERNKMYRGSALDPSQFSANSIPIHGSSRILGGRAEAEALMARMEASKLKMISNNVVSVPGDMNSPDGSSFRSIDED